MRMLRKPFLAAALGAAAFGVVQSATADDQPAREYVVVYEQGASGASAREAVKDAGGTLVKENAEVGVATVRSSDADFVANAAAEDALVGAAADRPIGNGRAGRQEEGDPGRGRARLGQGREGQEGRAARRQPVGHADDRRHAGAVLPDPAGLAEGARRHPRHGCRRVASGHRAELREVAVAQLHHGHAGHRRALRGRAGPVLHRRRPTSTRAATERTWRAPSARRSTAPASRAWPRRPAS